MKEIVSAGGLIVRKKSDKWQILLIKDASGSWTFPKGETEKDESLQETAKREISEEVGLSDLKLVNRLDPINYIYKRNGTVFKIVYYFIFEDTNNQTPVCQTEEGITEAVWVDLGDAEKIISYPDTNILLINQALDILNNN